MKTNRRIIVQWILPILYVIIGAALGICGELGVVDQFWNGLGAAFVVMGVLRLIRLIRYSTNTEYKEQTDTAIQDERNRFIRNKAWAWAGYLYIMIAAVATIVFKLLDQETLMFFCSGSVCLLLIVYWISYFILRKKY